MASTTSAAFRDFLIRLDLTAVQKEALQSRRKVTHGYLAERFPQTSDMPLVRTRLMGSASRGTLIRPFDDIDVLAVFSNAGDAYRRYKSDSRKFLYRVRDALNTFNVKVVGARGQAVRLFYAESPHVDIAPVIPRSAGGYLLPAGDGSWIITGPDGHDDWLKERAKLAGANLIPLIRMLKQWNRAHSHRLKSFHLEVVVGTSFGTVGGSLPVAVEKFFAWAPKHIDVQDPAGFSGNLGAYLSTATRRDLLGSLATSAMRAGKALTAESRGDHEEAIRLWRIVFGDMFPAFG